MANSGSGRFGSDAVKKLESESLKLKFNFHKEGKTGFMLSCTLHYITLHYITFCPIHFLTVSNTDTNFILRRMNPNKNILKVK